MSKIQLPDNWRALTNEVLFTQYQALAFRAKQYDVVKLIAEEFKNRLEAKGMVKTRSFGWMHVDDITDGLEMGAIADDEDGDFDVVRHEKLEGIDAAKKQMGGQVINTTGGVARSEKLDMSRWHAWWARVKANRRANE